MEYKITDRPSVNKIAIASIFVCFVTFLSACNNDSKEVDTEEEPIVVVETPEEEPEVEEETFLLPEIDCLFGIPQTIQWHPEVDTGIHVMLAIDEAKDLDNDVAYAVMVHDLGKGITPEDVLPSHRGHETAGIPLVKAVSQRLKVPNHYKKLALLVCQWHLHAHTAMELRAATIEKLFSRLNAYRQAELLEKFILACQADATGRWGDEFKTYPQADYLRELFNAAQQIDKQSLYDRGYEGEELGKQIRQLRISAIQSKKQQLLQTPIKN